MLRLMSAAGKLPAFAAFCFFFCAFQPSVAWSSNTPPSISGTPRDSVIVGNGYGFTMSVTTDVAASTGYGSPGDFGWDGAASTFFRVDPKERLVVLVMTQRMPTDLEVQVKAKTLAFQAITDK